MNPIYRFWIKGKSSNLLNPDTINFSDPESQYGTSDYIDVLPNRTYILRDKDNSTVTIQYYLCFDKSKQLIEQHLSAEDYADTPDGCYYLVVAVPKTYMEQPQDVGVFANSTFTTFESYSKGFVRPIYKDDLTIEYAKENGEMFFRRKLNGYLTFVREDYDFILSRTIEYKFELVLFISYDRGKTWEEYWKGFFYWGDCEFDDDSKKCSVNPSCEDEYTKILEGIENEYDLIQLAPAMKRINYWKRPVFQFYVVESNKNGGFGASTIGSFQMGCYWEQEANATGNRNTLINTYHFGEIRFFRKAIVAGSNVEAINGIYIGYDTSGSYSTTYELRGYNKDGTPNGYKLGVYPDETYGVLAKLLTTDDVLCYTGLNHSFDIDFQHPVGGGATQPCVADLSYYTCYGRIVNDIGIGTSLPSDDITDTSGYGYASPMGISSGGQTGWEGFIHFEYLFSDEPTQYGQYYDDNGLVGYYKAPRGQFAEQKDFQPISRNSWGDISFWLNNTKWALINLSNNYGCKPIVLKNAYSLASSIEKLIKAIDPSLEFQLTNEYSYLMTTLMEQILYITPKSNILVSEYDTPAYKGEITLKSLLNTLRDMFRAYWYIEGNKFKIERVDFFMNGMSYNEDPSVGRDLTLEINSRNNKALDYAFNKWKFDKASLPERYEFGWMDECTDIFKGKPLIILSSLVTKNMKEDITISDFSTDINLMLISPSQFSNDGFVMLSCDSNDEVINWNMSQGYYIQNGMLSFLYLEQNYYKYDLPAAYYKIGEDGTQQIASGVEKSKVQEVNFPCLTDPNILNLIKTSIGNGQFEKLSINLSSRNGKATLKYYPYGI